MIYSKIILYLVIGNLISNINFSTIRVVQNSTSIASFLSLDPLNLNQSPYAAFNLNPLSFVDRNGKAPKSVVQILTPKFGKDRLEQYENLDRVFDQGLRGQVDYQVMDAYRKTAMVVNKSVNQMIERELNDRYSFVRKELVYEIQASYKNGIRGEVFSEQGAEMDVPGFGKAKLSFMKQKISRNLQESSAEAILEHSNLEQKIFHYEHMWWDMQIRNHMEQLGNEGFGGIYEVTPWFYIYDEPIYLNAQEMNELYHRDDFLHSDLFRGIMNNRSYYGYRYVLGENITVLDLLNGDRRGFPRNGQLYQSFRQNSITLYGEDGESSVTTSFRRFSMLE